MSTVSELVAGFRQDLAGVRSRVIGITENDILYSLIGESVLYGCKVTGSTASPQDNVVNLEGQASGDSANLNPDLSLTPTIGYEYPNIACTKGKAFRALDLTATVETAPATGTARYDIAYIYVGQSGAGFGIASGTPDAAVKTDFDSNGLDGSAYGAAAITDPALPAGAMPVARIYVEDVYPGISNAQIADLRVLGRAVLEFVASIVLSSVSDKEILQYDTATGKWINQTLAEADIATATELALKAPIADPTFTGVATAPVLKTGEERYQASFAQRFNQSYSPASTLAVGEFQEILTVTPSSASQNYDIIARVTAVSGAITQVMDVILGLRSNTLPDLSWNGSYQNYIDGSTVTFVKPVLWVKETTTAAFKFALEGLVACQNVHVEVLMVNRASTYVANVSMNTTAASEVAAVPAGFTQYDIVQVLTKYNGTITYAGKQTMPASTTSAASMNLPHGTAPSSPANGDIWTTTSGILARINGTTRDLYHSGNLADASQAEAEAGTSTSRRAFTPQRVAQAIAALASAATFLPAGTGGVATAMQARLNKVIYADEYGTLQQAFDAAPEGGMVIIPAGTYAITTTITSTKEVFVYARGAVFEVNANVSAFYFSTAPERKALTADYDAGDTAIAVTALSAALTKGQPFKIISEAVDPANRDSGSSTSQYRCGEWAFADGGTTTSISLQQPLRFPFGKSPTSTAGEEATVAAYTTALTAEVIVLSGKTMQWEGGEIVYQDGNDASWNAAAFVVEGYYNPSVSVNISRGYGPGIIPRGTFSALVRDCIIKNLNNNTSLGQYGYGVADTGFATKVDNCAFANTRHGYTTNASPATDAQLATAPYALAVGRTMGCRVSDSSGTGNSTGVFDTHHDAEDVSFINCHAMEGDYGFSARGRNITFDSCLATNVEVGFILLTEYQSGDADDDYFVAGKPEGATTVTLVNCSAKVADRVIQADYCRRVKVVNGDFESSSHRLIDNNGSRMYLAGDIRFAVTTFDGAKAITEVTGTGVIDVAILASDMVDADWFPLVETSSSCHIEIDATQATDASNALYIMRTADSTCKVHNQGVIHADVSQDFSHVLAGTASNYTATARSEFVWSVDGAADSTLTNGLLGSAFKARAADGTVKYDATEPGSEKLVYGSVPGTAHAGTGAIATSVFIPEFDAVSLIDEAGHYARFELVIGKTGTTGAATIRSRISADFNFDITMASTDLTLKAVYEIFTLADNSHLVLINGQASPGTGLASPAGTFLQRVVETTNLAAATYLLRIDVNAAVGDTITLLSCRVYSDIVAVNL